MDSYAEPVDPLDETYEKFGQLLRSLRGFLLRVCLHRAGLRPDQAEDLYQDIVADLWQQWPTFRHYDNPAAWFRRCALNAAVSDWRSRKGAPRLVPIDEQLRADLAAEAADPCVEQLYHLINLLPDDEQQLLFLHLDVLSYENMAAVTGSTPAAAKQHVYRIRKKLVLLNQQEHERESKPL